MLEISNPPFYPPPTTTQQSVCLLILLLNLLWISLSICHYASQTPSSLFRGIPLLPPYSQYLPIHLLTQLLNDILKIQRSGCLGGSVDWAPYSWFRLRSWSPVSWDWAPCPILGSALTARSLLKVLPSLSAPPLLVHPLSPSQNK